MAGIELTTHEAELERYKLKVDGRRFSSGSPVLGRQVDRGGGGSWRVIRRALVSRPIFRQNFSKVFSHILDFFTDK